MSDVEERVRTALETIRPALQADGGDIELVNVEGDTVTVRLVGACGGCPMAHITLKQGVEARIKQLVPEIVRVEAVPY